MDLQLTPAEIRTWSTSQIANIPSEEIPLLSSLQIQALSWAQLRALTATQIGTLTPEQLSTIPATEIHGDRYVDESDSPDYSYYPGYYPGSGNNKLVALKTSQISSLSTAQINAWSSWPAGDTSIQFRSLRSNQIAALGSGQLIAIQADLITTLRSAQLSALTLQQVSSLVTDQISTLFKRNPQPDYPWNNLDTPISSGFLKLLSGAQIAAIGNEDFSTLPPQLVTAFATSQTGALQTGQIELARDAEPVGRVFK